MGHVILRRWHLLDSNADLRATARLSLGHGVRAVSVCLGLAASLASLAAQDGFILTPQAIRKHLDTRYLDFEALIQIDREPTDAMRRHMDSLTNRAMEQAAGLSGSEREAIEHSILANTEKAQRVQRDILYVRRIGSEYLVRQAASPSEATNVRSAISTDVRGAEGVISNVFWRMGYKAQDDSIMAVFHTFEAGTGARGILTSPEFHRNISWVTNLGLPIDEGSVEWRDATTFLAAVAGDGRRLIGRLEVDERGHCSALAARLHEERTDEVPGVLRLVTFLGPAFAAPNAVNVPAHYRYEIFFKGELASRYEVRILDLKTPARQRVMSPMALAGEEQHKVVALATISETNAITLIHRGDHLHSLDEFLPPSRQGFAFGLVLVLVLLAPICLIVIAKVLSRRRE